MARVNLPIPVFDMNRYIVNGQSESQDNFSYFVEAKSEFDAVQKVAKVVVDKINQRVCTLVDFSGKYVITPFKNIDNNNWSKYCWSVNVTPTEKQKEVLL